MNQVSAGKSVDLVKGLVKSPKDRDLQRRAASVASGKDVMLSPTDANAALVAREFGVGWTP